MTEEEIVYRPFFISKQKPSIVFHSAVIRENLIKIPEDEIEYIVQTIQQELPKWWILGQVLDDDTYRFPIKQYFIYYKIIMDGPL